MSALPEARRTRGREAARPAALAAAVAAALLAPAAGKVVGHHTTCQGEIQMSGLGGTPVYATGSSHTPSGTRIGMPHNSGVSITQVCSSTWNPYKFMPFPLLGQTLSFKVDLSKVSCGCNLAVYFVLEPAKHTNGSSSEGNCDYSPYYCDANQVCGQWCPELDIMEANTGAFQATPHSCSDSSTPKYYSCDRNGQFQRTREHPGGYGPGPSNTIDTTRPFEVRTRFEGSPSANGSPPRLTKMETTLVQAGNQLVLTSQAPAEYLASMALAMDEGMALRITYWGGQASAMSWLDSPPCGQQECNAQTAGLAELWDFAVSPGLPQFQPPSPSPSGKPVQPSGPSWFVIVCAWLFIGGGVCALAYAVYRSRERIAAHLPKKQGDYLRALNCERGELATACMKGERESECDDDDDPDAAAVEKVEHGDAYCGTSRRTDPSALAEPTPSPAGRWPLAPQAQAGADAGGRAAAAATAHAGGGGATGYAALGPRVGGAIDSLMRHVETAKIYASKFFGEDWVNARKAWAYANDLVYSKLRPPFKIGDDVVVIKALNIKRAKVFEVDAKGKVCELHGDEAVSVEFVSASRRFWTSSTPAMRVQGQLMLHIESEEQKAFRKKTGQIVISGGCAAVFLTILTLVLASKAMRGGGAQSGIPSGGCCAWQEGVCGHTTSYCSVQDHCVQKCYGQWLVPS